MAERASVFQGVQIGVEATPGTAVPANKQLNSLQIEPGITLDLSPFRPMGNKFATVTGVGKDWTQSRFRGQATYTEIAYPLSSLFGAATITGPGTDGQYTWVFNPASTGPDAFTSFTVQQGSSVRAQQFAYGVFASLGLQFDRDRVEISGNMIGQALTDGVSMTASPTALALIPILGKQIDVYVDTTSASLGTTKVGRLLRGNWQFGQNKYNPLWVVDSSQSSFVAVVEAAPQATFQMLLEADANGMAYLTDARAGTTMFARLKATGPLIAGATNYSLQIDMAVEVGRVEAYTDQDAVYAIPLDWNLIHDGTWGKALTATLVTTLAAL